MQTNWIQLTDQPLSTAASTDFLTIPTAGGIAIFLGITRAETSPTGSPLAALDYEAYPEMALAQLHNLATNARARWPILKLAILHRTGKVPVGHPSVLIAVSTPHRAAAFESSRWLIDTLKSQVPIWKKEVWSDGSSTWVEGTPVSV